MPALALSSKSKMSKSFIARSFAKPAAVFLFNCISPCPPLLLAEGLKSLSVLITP